MTMGFDPVLRQHPLHHHAVVQGKSDEDRQDVVPLMQEPDHQGKVHGHHAKPELDDIQRHIHQASDQDIRDACCRSPCKPDLVQDEHRFHHAIDWVQFHLDCTCQPEPEEEEHHFHQASDGVQLHLDCTC